MANLGKMPFYFAFQNRRMKAKVKRNLTFGSKTKKKSTKNGGLCLEGSTWSDSSANELPAYDNTAFSLPRRHSLEGSLYNGTSAISPPLLRRVLSPLSGKTTERGPPKPPRMMEKKMFTCENPECQKTEELLGMIAINFKACPACFTHYCSTKCRVEHWSQHKVVCHYGRMKSYVKTISEICQNDDNVRALLSSLASSGYYDKGRGCVMLIFANPNAARLFIEEKIGEKPTYSSLGQIQTLGVRTDHQKNLIELISSYKPESEHVLNIAIVAERNLPASPVPRNKEPCVIEQFLVSLKPNTECNSRERSRRSSL